MVDVAVTTLTAEADANKTVVTTEHSVATTVENDTHVVTDSVIDTIVEEVDGTDLDVASSLGLSVQVDETITSTTVVTDKTTQETDQEVTT